MALRSARVNAEASALGRGRLAAVAAAEADRTLQLVGQEGDLLPRARGALRRRSRLPPRTASSCSSCRRARYAALASASRRTPSIADVTDRHAALRRRRPPMRRRPRSASQVQRMELAAGLGQEASEIVHSLRVAHANGRALVGDGPVLALTQEPRCPHRGEFLRVASGDRRRLIWASSATHPELARVASAERSSASHAPRRPAPIPQTAARRPDHAGCGRSTCARAIRSFSLHRGRQVLDRVVEATGWSSPAAQGTDRSRRRYPPPGRPRATRRRAQLLVEDGGLIAARRAGCRPRWPSRCPGAIRYRGRARETRPARGP